MSKFNQIEITATNTLIEFDLLKAPINLKRLAKKLDITIEEQDLDDDISGFLLKDKLNSTIGINKYHAKVRKRFTLAHEIGHFKLHNIDSPIFVDYSYKGSMLRSKESNKIYRRANNKVNPTMEKEANFFAANLLMPKSLIKLEIEKLNNNLDYDNKVSKLAEIFIVSTQAMDYRLKSLRYYDYGF